MPCEYCGTPDTNPECHVVPKFIIRYLRANSIRDTLLYTWDHRGFAHNMIAGPYFCKQCDNELFGALWEKAFSRDVFPDPMKANAKWGMEFPLRFTLLMCYRYAIHSLVVDPNRAHQPIGVLFRDHAKAALLDLSQVGHSLFVYPYVYRPFTETCSFRVGINAFLSLGFHDRFRLAANGLPDCYFIQLPKMILLFSVGDLAVAGKPGFSDLVDLRLNKVIDPKSANVQIPELYAGVLNEGVQDTMRDQTSRNAWFEYHDPMDQRVNPTKMVYQAREADRALAEWQEANCP